MKALIGVMPEDQIRKRMLAIAKGDPAAGEPKIWFTSVKAFAQVLRNENIALPWQTDERKDSNP